MRFSLANGAIEITDAKGALVWTGRPLDRPVLTVLPLRDADACVVLCDWDAEIGRFENVMRLTSGGTVAWRAPLPPTSGSDCYVALTSDEGAIFANSWSCYRVRLDPDRGEILEAVFTK